MVTVNKQVIVAAFGRAAAHYKQHADLQRQSVDTLLAVLSRCEYTRILDAGYGLGWMSCHWRGRHAQVTVLDLSLPMLVQTRQKDTADHYLARDIEPLPLATVAFDLAWGNLAVQWCGNLSAALCELYRVMRPKGVVAFTMLVQGLLPEPHQAWQAMDRRPHVNRFLPPDEIEQPLNGVHYQHHIRSTTLWFDDALSVMRPPGGIGAAHFHEGRNPQISTRS